MFKATLSSASLFKSIVETVKDLISDASFDCKEESIYMQAMDGSHVAMVMLKMDVGLFEKYQCDEPLVLGMSFNELAKVFKCSRVDDELTIRCDGKDSDVVTFNFENDKGRNEEITLKLMDINSEYLGIPDQSYDFVIEMPSNEFQRACKDISTFSDSLTISASKYGISFSGSGDIATNTIHYNNSNTDVIITAASDATLQMSFSISHLLQFSKAASLSDCTRISFHNSVPLFVEYQIHDANGNVNGVLSIMLAPKIEEKIDE